MQRLFQRYVGVSPKWVIRRYRMHDAAERIAQGKEVDWISMANELGYFDQAHFIKDFRAQMGRSPTEYAAAIRAASA
jgi:AraC-like DNA-binding protein